MNPSAGPPPALLSLAPPDEFILLDWLRARVSRLMIEEIARNDRGAQIEANIAAIHRHMESGTRPGLLPWNPREVLELERWSEPDDAYLDSPPSGVHGHIRRSLACTILLRSAAYLHPQEKSEEEFFVETSAGTAIQLTRSAVALRSETGVVVMRFLLWVHSQQSHPAFQPFVSFCVLLLEVFTGIRTDFSDTLAWVEREENRSRELLGDAVASPRWLLGVSDYENSKDQRERWTSTASRILTQPSIAGSPQLQEDLRRFVERIAAR